MDWATLPTLHSPFRLMPTLHLLSSSTLGCYHSQDHCSTVSLTCPNLCDMLYKNTDLIGNISSLLPLWFSDVTTIQFTLVLQAILKYYMTFHLSSISQRAEQSTVHNKLTHLPLFQKHLIKYHCDYSHQFMPDFLLNSY